MLQAHFVIRCRHITEVEAHAFHCTDAGPAALFLKLQGKQLHHGRPGHTAGRREVSVQRVQATATSEIACLMMDSFDCSYPMCQLDIDSP